MLPSRYDPTIHTLTNIPSDSTQGKVYDVTGNKMYQPGNSYNGECQMRIPQHSKWSLFAFAALSSSLLGILLT